MSFSIKSVKYLERGKKCYYLCSVKSKKTPREPGMQMTKRE